MTCDRIQSDLSRMLDGEPTRLDRSILLRHLDRCAACRDFMGLSKQIAESYRAHVQGGIDALRRLEERPVSRRRFPLAVSALLAAGVLLVLAGSWIGGFQRGSPQPAVEIVAGERIMIRPAIGLFPRGFGWEEPRFRPVEEDPLPSLAQLGSARGSKRSGVPRSLQEEWDELDAGRDPLRLLFPRDSVPMLPRLID